MNLLIFFSTIISTIILGIVLRWDPPIQISRKLFQVIAGYATLLEEEYNVRSITDHPVAEQDIKYSSHFEWICDVSRGDSNNCYTTVSTQYCSNNTQYSNTFWKFPNITCINSASTTLACETPQYLNGSCHNIVQQIKKFKDSTQLVLTNREIGSDLQQSFHNGSSQNKSCYLAGDSLIWQGGIPLLEADSNGNCVSWNSKIEYGRNYSNICVYNSLTVNTTLFNPPSSPNPVICNCEECLVNIQNLETNQNVTGPCLVPSDIRLILTVSNGIVMSSKVKRNMILCEEGEEIVVRSSIVFLRASYVDEEKTIFDKQRGMFECPSEILCWKELTYPLLLWNTVNNEQQTILLFISIVLSSLVLKLLY